MALMGWVFGVSHVLDSSGFPPVSGALFSRILHLAFGGIIVVSPGEFHTFRNL
jgi:hypothetical protein